MEDKRRRPSRAARWILGKLRVYSTRYFIKEDFEEEYISLCGSEGRRQAGRWFWRQTFLAAGYYVKYRFSGRSFMLKNYLKTTFRHMKRNKVYSFINIAGLAVGLACFVLILLFVRFELSFDNFHENGDQIYRFYKKREVAGTSYMGNSYFMTTPAILAPTLKETFPEVVNATRLIEAKNMLLTNEGKQLYEDGICADSEFLNIFTLPLVRGSKADALAEPFRIVLAESLAQKIFGSDDALGKFLRISTQANDYKITGIMKDVPANSHLKFNFIISFITLKTQNRNLDDWYSNSFFTYVQLQGGTDTREFEKKITVFLDRYAPKRQAHYTGYLQPLRRTHLYSHFNFDPALTGDIKNIYLYSAIGFIILLIACINYMNLSTARSSQRAKEVGMRKVVGASRREIIRQFLGESMLTASLALVLGLLLVKLALPLFNSFLGQTIPFDLSESPFWILALFIVILFVGLFSGSYPALFLSAFRPVQILKRETGWAKKGAGLRNGLVTFQFSISIILIVCTIVVYSQLQFIRHKDPGYNREHVVVVPLKDIQMGEKLEVIKDLLNKNPNVQGVSASSHLPIAIGNRNTITVLNSDGEEVKTSMYYALVDYDFIDVFDIKLIAGRNFSRDFSTDPDDAVIINETAAERLGWKDPLGKSYSNLKDWDQKVIGVVKDFHFQSYHLDIEPMALLMKGFWASYLYVKIKPTDIPGTIAHIREVYDEHKIHHAFDYYFLDDAFNRVYQAEQKFGTTFRIFSFLAVFISALGLFGLASFSSEQKTKEIGIRKVLGASVFSITFLLSRQFTRWVLIANLISWPVAYYAMNRWLQSYAYRTTIQVWIFALAACLALLIALATVSYQSIRAATANPVDSLRYE
jgi:putative ABC transport system permease protein